MTNLGIPNSDMVNFPPLGEWAARGACVPVDPALFDVVDEDGDADASTRRLLTAAGICAGCPVRELCESEARKHGHFGVWGGILFRGHRGANPVDLAAHVHDTGFWFKLRSNLRGNAVKRASGRPHRLGGVA